MSPENLPTEILDVLKDFNHDVLNAINKANKILNNSTYLNDETSKQISDINDTLLDLSDIVNHDIYLIDNIKRKKSQIADL